MIYKHKNFQLDTISRKIFDSNGRELKITSNAYRLLEFLCKKRNATLTDVGEYLDHAKEYTENHIRQYRYKINSVIGEDVIEYRNSIYSIIGEIRIVEKLDLPKDNLENNRITDFGLTP